MILWNCTKASKTTTFGWKAYGFCFLGFQQHIVHRLFEERKKNQQRLFLCIVGPIGRRTRKKTPLLDGEKMHVLQDNASAHKSIKIMAKINELRFGLLPHPSYFLDLAPSIFVLFPNLQRWLQEQRFLSNEEVKWETDGYFAGLYKSYYKKGIKMLKDR